MMPPEERLFSGVRIGVILAAIVLNVVIWAVFLWVVVKLVKLAWGA